MRLEPLAASLLKRIARGRMMGARLNDASYAPHIAAMRFLANRGMLRELDPDECTEGRLEFEITDRGRARANDGVPSDRDLKIAKAAATQSYATVGKHHGITKQRVEQIVRKVEDWRALDAMVSDNAIEEK